MTVDKHEAMLKYLLQCPTVSNNPLFFNFGELKENSTQFITTSNSEKYTQRFIDGTEAKNYLFTLLTFKTISYNAIVKKEGYPAENITELAEFQEVIDWVNAQDDLNNYPDFGAECHIDRIMCTTANPVIADVDSDIEPAIATYSITISVDYLDKSKCVWG